MAGWRGLGAWTAVAAAIWSAGFLIGSWADLPDGKPAEPFAAAVEPGFVGILSTNARVLAGYLSGLASCGSSAAATLLLNGAFCGIQWQEAAREIGALPLAALLLPHGVLELAGFALAGAAGLGGIPLAAWLMRRRAPKPGVACAWLWAAALSVLLVAAAAAVEALLLN